MTIAAALVVLLLAGGGGQRAIVPRPGAEEHGRRQTILAIEDRRAATRAELQLLIALAQGAGGDETVDAATRTGAVRALGRLERRDLIPVLLDLAARKEGRTQAETALMVTLRAHAGAGHDPEVTAATGMLLAQTSSPRILGFLPYTTPQQIQLAETRLLALARDADSYGPVAAALEVLARKHRRLQELREPAIDFLRRAATRALPGMRPDDSAAARVALAALAAAGQADQETIAAGLRDRDDQVRRTAMDALNGAGAAVDAATRTELTRSALQDPSFSVRYEALRGWIRRETSDHGCDPLIAALSDSSLHVTLAAIDALGERCPGDEGITSRVASESTTPPTVGDWQREAHAFVALAKRSPDRAAMAMSAFSGHVVWQVRMYAARAAAAMKDAATLDRLAYDPDDNVREAALGPFRALKGSGSDAAFAAALGRSDYQLLRTAAMGLERAAPDRHLLAALVGALERVTAEGKDTSRDTRLALLERIRAMGGRDQLPLYERLLRDFDPRVAVAAAEACTTLSTKACAADPRPRARPAVPTREELAEPLKAVVELDNGRRFRMVFDKALAPLAYARFRRLARDGYYDGRTFHRVVPNFVIQGGSPGANEYAGDGPFMRDELGGAHHRGAVGISTRGRDTGDAQIFVNLVHNPRLDFEYTVFATVPDEDMDIVDTVQEGMRIRRIHFQRQ